MPTVTLNRKTIDKLMGQKLTDERLNDRIPYLGASIEKMDKDMIHLEIEPNRPDMLSEQGFARALSSFLGINTGLRKYTAKKSSHKVIVENSVKSVRPYTACAIIKGLSFDDEKIKEVIQIQEKLHVTYGRNRKKVAIGIYPFEKIKTPIRFAAKKPADIKFQPLEFPRELNGLQILSQHPTGRDYGHLLEGLEKYPVFIDANDKILSMPPIINSHDVGKINNGTKDVFIECSGFDYPVLGKCLNIIVTALADMGGEICTMEIDLYGKKIVSPDLSSKEITIDRDYIKKRLGMDLKEKEIKQLLFRMGYSYSKGNVNVPCYRADVLHQIDIVEDIAIAYGYENIEESIPKVVTVGEESDFEVFKRKIGDMLAGLGLIECKTFHITNKEYQSRMMNQEIRVVELANALNKDYSCLTAWNIPLLIEILQNNKHNEYPQNIFSMGGIFKKDATVDTGVLEQESLACVLCSDESDYTRIRQILDYIFRMIGRDYNIDSTSHGSFIEGRVGKIKSGEKNVGYIGEISPEVLLNWEIDVPAACFELNLSKLFY